MNEEELRKKIIEGLNKKGGYATSLGGGRFDILYVGKNKRYNVIELKKIKDLRYTPKTDQDIGVRFTTEQSESLRALGEYSPTIVVEEDNTFYIIDNASVSRLVLDPERSQFKDIILSKRYFEEFGPLDFDTAIHKLIELG